MTEKTLPFLMVALALGLTVGLARADAEGRVIDYRITRNGDDIGTHRVRFERGDSQMTLEHEISIRVRILALEAYRYDLRAREVWREGRLVGFSSTTDRNGDALQVFARRGGSGIRVRAAGGERVTPWGTLGCELRSVNHRFLEVGTRLPEELRALEPQLRERIAARLSRGKLDLVMRLRAPEAAANLQVDEALLGQLGRLAHRLTSDFPNLQVSFTDLLQLPGVTRGEATDAAALQVEALALLDQVLDGFVEAREREGGKLAAAISERVDGIERIATEVRTLIPAIRDGQRAKLAARLADLPHPVDPGRAEQELVLWLQKLDVDEELDRLGSHIVEIRRVLKQREPVGRRLDFLLQEFNREANTLGSKSVDSRTSNAAVELKVLIDQIREQVQNIE